MEKTENSLPIFHGSAFIIPDGSTENIFEVLKITHIQCTLNISRQGLLKKVYLVVCDPTGNMGLRKTIKTVEIIMKEQTKRTNLLLQKQQPPKATIMAETSC